MCDNMYENTCNKDYPCEGVRDYPAMDNLDFTLSRLDAKQPQLDQWSGLDLHTSGYRYYARTYFLGVLSKINKLLFIYNYNTQQLGLFYFIGSLEFQVYFRQDSGNLSKGVYKGSQKSYNPFHIR